jgi:phosphoserine phosphatase
MTQEPTLLMVTVTGRDRPGITAAFSKVMLEHGVEVLDVEQASLADLLGLYLLLDLGAASAAKDSVIKDLLYEASRLELRLDFKLCQEGQCHPPHAGHLFVLTFFGGTRALAEVSAILGQEAVNIERISSFRQQGQGALELIINVAEAPSLGQLKKRLMLMSRELGIDLALQNMAAFRKNKRLVFFDMDSTLVDMEVIDEMARRAGVGREVARITEKAMRGDFDFEQSLIQRVALLKGLKVEELNDIRQHLPLSPGVPELIAALKWLGFKLGVVTGGFDFFADKLKEDLGLDFAFANRLEIKDGALTGRVLGQVIDAVGKAQLVNQTACGQGIGLDQVVVVGDGANDALMLGQAGLGIAYNAKRALDKVANVALGRQGLSNLFHLLGVTEQDVKEAHACA